MTGPTVEISKKLKPFLSELSFDRDAYTEGLVTVGLPEPRIDGASVRMCFSEAPYHTSSGIENVLEIGKIYRGFYDGSKNQINIFPRSIAYYQAHSSAPIDVPELFMSLTDSTLSADHNYVLAHETGHMLDFSERTAQELTYQRDHIKTRYKVRRLASRGAIIGALAGAGISEITNLPSIETTPAGILALSGLGFVIGASTVSKDIDP
jgi:hypothetical protein